MAEQTYDLGIAGLGPGTKIGEGGSAVVFRSRQEELDRDVAVKLLGFSSDDDTRRRFDRERRVMGRLSQHEGMVTVYETGFNSRGEPYIVMPLLGRSLHDEITGEPLPWRRAVEIMAEVSRTVGFAHEQGIVHRDLKPGNIMMSTSGRPLVADFGIARIIDAKTNLQATALALTPAYSPPEALETTIAEPTSDVYSLGATLHALIMGYPPYVEPGGSATLMALMRRIVDDPVPDIRPAAPDEVQAILERSMAKRPADRYQSVADFADALDAVLATAPNGDDPTVVVAPPSPPPSRRRGVVVAGLAVAAVALAGGAVALVGSGGSDDDDAVAATTAVTEVPAPSTGATVVTATDVPPPADTAVDEPVLVVAGGEVFLLPFDEAGDDGFTISVAAKPDVDLVSFVEAGGPTAEVDAPPSSDGSTAVTGVVGTDPGVFAGVEGVAPCAPDDLIASLVPDAPETTAWAAVQDISVDEIPTFIEGLTATVLTGDVRVTDHRFVDGLAEPTQAVLQIGTAVLVDEYGEMQVRCASGSPLAPPEPVEGTTNYIGVAWDTFTPTATVAVVPAPTPVVEFVLTDVAGGPDFVRPVGSSGATDRPLLPGEILATGTFTSFTGLDGGSIDSSSIEIIFSPDGGDVVGSFSYTISIDGFSLNSVGDLTGTFDAATGAITGSGFATTSGAGVEASGGGTWSATVDPAAGTIAGVGGDGDGGAFFDLTFPPYST